MSGEHKVASLDYPVGLEIGPELWIAFQEHHFHQICYLGLNYSALSSIQYIPVIKVILLNMVWKTLHTHSRSFRHMGPFKWQLKEKKRHLISFFITLWYRNHVHINCWFQKIWLSADLHACVSFSGDLPCNGKTATRAFLPLPNLNWIGPKSYQRKFRR